MCALGRHFSSGLQQESSSYDFTRAQNLFGVRVICNPSILWVGIFQVAYSRRALVMISRVLRIYLELGLFATLLYPLQFTKFCETFRTLTPFARFEANCLSQVDVVVGPPLVFAT